MFLVALVCLFVFCLFVSLSVCGQHYSKHARVEQEGSIPEIVFQGEVIKNVSSHKHLGVFISSDRKWNNHIEYLCERASKKLSMLKSLKFSLDWKSLETIFCLIH